MRAITLYQMAKLRGSVLMRRIITVIIVFAMCLMPGACGGPGAVPGSTREADMDAAPSENAVVLPYSFANAAKVYADPDAYKGKTYESLFMIKGGKQQYEGGKTVYYAIGYKKDESLNTYTILDFGDREVPDIADGEVVYALGTIEGKGFISDGKGNSVDTLWLGVASIEYDVSKAGITAQSKTYEFKDGKHIAENGTLSIGIMSLNFTQDSLMLNTKTVDSSVKSMETYYIDIVIHQGGYCAYYSNCDFWIQPNGMTSFDNVPFPAFDSTKNMTIMFVPFRDDGSLVCEPLTVEIELSK